MSSDYGSHCAADGYVGGNNENGPKKCEDLGEKVNTHRPNGEVSALDSIKGYNGKNDEFCNVNM